MSDFKSNPLRKTKSDQTERREAVRERERGKSGGGGGGGGGGGARISVLCLRWRRAKGMR